MEEYIDFLPLGTICTYFFPDGTVLSAKGDSEDFTREVEAKTGESADSVRAYLRYSRGIYDKTNQLFLWNSLHRLSTYFKPEIWKGVLSRGKLDASRSMDEANRSFFHDPRMVQLFNRYATYNGSSPYRVPATLNIIPHVEYSMGAYASRGGIHAIPQALYKLATELGVEFRLGWEVGYIRSEDGRVTGIEESPAALSGDVGHRGPAGKGGPEGQGGGDENDGDVEFIPADIVISNVDARRTYEELLLDPKAPYAERYRSLEPSSSGMVFFWGMKSSYPELTVNNIFFSGDYPAEFRSLFEELKTPEDPTVYVNITAKLSPGDAPKGGENWFVLVNAPRNDGQNWEEEVVRTRSSVLRRIEKALGRPIEKDIKEEQVLTPDRIERETGSYYGSLYGISSNTKTAAFLRHPAATRRYQGLYFCGGSVHPGGGMPLAILSGKIAADTIRKRHSRKKGD